MEEDEGGTKQGTRRPRRFDPERRDRILEATLDCIAEFGVSGTTHRLIAARADVPLGSLTYHFASIDDVVARAFGRFVDAQNTGFERLFSGVRTRADLVAVMVDLVAGVSDRSRSGALGFELHLAALRGPELRDLAEGWTLQSRRVLERFLDTTAAARVDALLEGMIMHALLATSPATRSDIESQISGALPSGLRAVPEPPASTRAEASVR